jgi:D-amino peptidase
MRVFISADIEGVAGITARDEAGKGKPGYGPFRSQMDAEVAAACAGALAGGATSVVVKDAHGDGRNLSPAALPPPAQLIRGYNGHPFAMVQGIDATFDTAFFIGYHSHAGSGGNPLAHTLSSTKLFGIRLDGAPVSELRLHALAAGTVGVPVALVSGDRALCDEAEALIPGCRTVAVSEGVGASTLSLHPTDAVERIREAAASALEGPLPDALAPAGPHRLEVVYRDPPAAYVRSFYPGADLVDDCTVSVEVADYFDVLRALIFLVGL